MAQVNADGNCLFLQNFHAFDNKLSALCIAELCPMPRAGTGTAF
jgi:hypothetical protein